MMAQKAIKTIDGRNLYYFFLAGAQKIFQNQDEINSINVFPVSDHDTGTNLANTVRSVATILRPEPSFTLTANNMAEAALIGARGNSGIIFAQFLYGFSLEIGDKTSVSIEDFIEGLNRSIDIVYQAVSEPVEGTMLTVMREWAEFLDKRKENFNDFVHLITESMQVLNRSLHDTKNKLGVLTKNNVVDAGAKGFVLFIEGIFELIRNGNIRQLRKNSIGVANDLIHDAGETDSSISYRYCTEALIKDITISREELKCILTEFGDSAVIAGSKKIRRLHVHTDRPADLLEKLRPVGSLVYQKADDMLRQYETVHHRKWPIAIVTDSTCDLDEKILDKYQIHILPINIHFGDNHFLDKVTIKPHQFYRMLDESPLYPTTAQVNEKSFYDLYSQLTQYYESVIAIHLTGQFSGTFASSLKAAAECSKKTGKPIDVVDSKNLSGGLGLLVLRIAEAVESGKTREEIVGSVQTWIQKTRILVSVRTLDYMVRGGRVSYAKGKIAKLLNINPIVSINPDGSSELFDKSFSQKSNMKKVMEIVRRETKDKKIWNYIVLHAGNADAADWYAAEMESLTGMPPVSKVNISPVIGMNAGVGAAAISFMVE